MMALGPQSNTKEIDMCHFSRLTQCLSRQGAQGHLTFSQFDLGTVEGIKSPFSRVGIHSLTYDLKVPNKGLVVW